MTRLRMGWWGIGWLALALASWVMLMPDPPVTVSMSNSDKLEHAVGFFCLYFWFAQLLDRSRHRVLFVTLLVYGVVIEIIQGYGGVRQMELADVAADAIGLLIAWAVTAGRGANVLLGLENRLFGGGRTL